MNPGLAVHLSGQTSAALSRKLEDRTSGPTVRVCILSLSKKASELGVGKEGFLGNQASGFIIKIPELRKANKQTNNKKPGS